MSAKPYLLLTGTFFALAAAVHALRLAQGWEIRLGSHAVPLGVSWIGLAVAGGVAAWAFRLARKS